MVFWPIWGVSSHHFDTQQRGFSFRYDAPLDMRMNQRAQLTAADVVNNYDHVRLTAILRDYGELDSPHRITQCIERSRSVNPIGTINELIEAVAPLPLVEVRASFWQNCFRRFVSR